MPECEHEQSGGSIDYEKEMNGKFSEHLTLRPMKLIQLKI